MTPEYLLQNGNWQTFNLLMTPNGFDDFKREITLLNQTAPQIYIHVSDDETLNHEVLRIGKAKHGGDR